MKIINAIVHDICIPFLLLLYLFVGILAAILSAIIEYTVFNELFSSSSASLMSPMIAAGSFVFILETSKLFLHYLTGRKECISDGSNLKKYAEHTSYLLYIPVIISFICTVVYSINTLDMPQYNAAAVNTQIEQADQQLILNIQEMTDNYNAEKLERLKPYQDALDKASDNITKLLESNAGPQKTQSALPALNAALQTAQENYDNKEKLLEEEYTQKKNDKEVELRNQHQNIVNSLNDISDPTVVSAYDNPIIEKVLRIFLSLFGQSAYSRKTYIMIALIFGLLMSTYLELTISTVFKLSSFSLEELNDAPQITSTDWKKWSENCILLLIRTFFALGIYCLVMLVFRKEIAERTFVHSVIVTIITIILAQHSILSESKSKDKPPFFKNILPALQDFFLQGTLTFVVYLMLGFFLGANAVNIDASSVAVAIGSTVALQFKRIPSINT